MGTLSPSPPPLSSLYFPPSRPYMLGTPHTCLVLPHTCLVLPRRPSDHSEPVSPASQAAILYLLLALAVFGRVFWLRHKRKRRPRRLAWCNVLCVFTRTVAVILPHIFLHDRAVRFFSITIWTASLPLSISLYFSLFSLSLCLSFWCFRRALRNRGCTATLRGVLLPAATPWQQHGRTDHFFFCVRCLGGDIRGHRQPGAAHCHHHSVADSRSGNAVRWLRLVPTAVVPPSYHPRKTLVHPRTTPLVHACTYVPAFTSCSYRPSTALVLLSYRPSCRPRTTPHRT